VACADSGRAVEDKRKIGKLNEQKASQLNMGRTSQYQIDKRGIKDKPIPGQVKSESRFNTPDMDSTMARGL
jgi:hypothetical protein